jgi:hypothetical protein
MVLLKRIPWHLLAVVITLAVGLSVAFWAGATEDYLGRLPSSSSLIGCANCHSTQDPSAGDLNLFGEAFRDNNLQWDALLASVDSDGDNCTNGAELGDADGDGELDGNVGEDSISNPGVPDDCANNALIDEATWGNLKNMFDLN